MRIYKRERMACDWCEAEIVGEYALILRDDGPAYRLHPGCTDLAAGVGMKVRRGEPIESAAELMLRLAARAEAIPDEDVPEPLSSAIEPFPPVDLVIPVHPAPPWENPEPADALPLKRCPKCGRDLPATEECFGRHGKARDGLQPSCKECASKRLNEGKRAKSERMVVESREESHDETATTCVETGGDTTATATDGEELSHVRISPGIMQEGGGRLKDEAPIGRAQCRRLREELDISPVAVDFCADVPNGSTDAYEMGRPTDDLTVLRISAAMRHLAALSPTGLERARHPEGGDSNGWGGAHAEHDNMRSRVIA